MDKGFFILLFPTRNVPCVSMHIHCAHHWGAPCTHCNEGVPRAFIDCPYVHSKLLFINPNISIARNIWCVHWIYLVLEVKISANVRSYDSVLEFYMYFSCECRNPQKMQFWSAPASSGIRSRVHPGPKKTKFRSLLLRQPTLESTLLHLTSRTTHYSTNWLVQRVITKSGHKVLGVRPSSRD